ncbi:MAG: cyclic nucleotide-binding domain-containing protein [Gammaproteobacteria bacterium]|nr:cyclic nucleotide-binding domain-containing protein [Gammaproteobacteria bacterium]
MTELLAELRAIELLAAMDDELLERIAAVVTIETLETGQTLMSEGTVGADLYFVRSGSLVATVRDGSSAIKIARPGPGDVIGESQLIAGGRRTATVQARTSSVVLRLAATELDMLVSSSEALRAALASIVQSRLRSAALRLALPLISLLRSRRLRQGLRQTFGEMMNEDSWIPLRVVVTNLTESRRAVFARGPVWQHVYASSSPPGVMPPVQYGASLYCDGGLVDNLPVSVLQEAGCRVKVASYIGSTSSLLAPKHGLPGSSWTLLLDRILRRGRYRDVPTLLTTMMQCILVPSSAQLEFARSSADIFFQPDLSAFPATDFTSALAMFETGQAHAHEVLVACRGEQADQDDGKEI